MAPRVGGLGQPSVGWAAVGQCLGGRIRRIRCQGGLSIAGANPFGDALAALVDKTVDSHPVEVRHLPTLTGLDRCHIMFIGRAEQGRFKTVLAKLARLPVLTVSDIGDFARTGGMIGLVEADQRIRFDINLTTARQANLKLSSQLLKLASIVEQNGGVP